MLCNNVTHTLRLQLAPQDATRVDKHISSIVSEHNSVIMGLCYAKQTCCGCIGSIKRTIAELHTPYCLYRYRATAWHTCVQSSIRFVWYTPAVTVIMGRQSRTPQSLHCEQTGQISSSFLSSYNSMCHICRPAGRSELVRAATPTRRAQWH